MSDIYKLNPDEILSPDEEVIHEQNKTIERLQEQLDEANRIIQVSIALVDKRPREMMRRYLKKWVVK